jgi:hypothetical protein
LKVSNAERFNGGFEFVVLTFFHVFVVDTTNSTVGDDEEQEPLLKFSAKTWLLIREPDA